MAEPLILVPTRGERDRIIRRLQQRSQEGWSCPLELDSISLCGFGPIAAAARTSQLICQSSQPPSHVILIGIAGGYGNRLPIGTAMMFGQVTVDGVGVGDGLLQQSAGQMGWRQWDGGDPIDDQLPLQAIADQKTVPPPMLLTVCSASADAAHAARRKQRHPQAIAEDMEGFGVASACHLNRIPCSVIRGISNVAGNRDLEQWEIATALDSAADLLADSIPIRSS